MTANVGAINIGEILHMICNLYFEMENCPCNYITFIEKSNNSIHFCFCFLLFPFLFFIFNDNSSNDNNWQGLIYVIDAERLLENTVAFRSKKNAKLATAGPVRTKYQWPHLSRNYKIRYRHGKLVGLPK
jgi:hypothetical protein